jgi:hypothetical protein
MTDKELLELAAKAADIKGWGFDVKGNLCIDPVVYLPWNPLADDGDALRLMVDLRLTAKVQVHEIEIFDEEGGCLYSIAIDRGESNYEQARRVIVRAAAEIGKQKE